MITIIRPQEGSDRSLIASKMHKGKRRKEKCAREDRRELLIKHYLLEGREDLEVVRACVHNGAAKGVF